MSQSFKYPKPFEAATSRSENELLLLCARARAGVEEAARITRLVSEKTDWDYFFKLAGRHAVLPLVFKSLSAHAPDAVPPPHLLKHRDKFRGNATRNLLLAGELVRVVRLFESEGVPVLAYKGPALAVSAYGDLSLRRFIDLDIVVNAGDARRAGELLRSEGFALAERLSESQEKILLRCQHNLAYTRDAGKLIVELHWGIASPRFAEIRLGEGSWKRAETVSLCGGDVRCLSPEDLLLALCVHGTKHLWERLSWICDVAEMLNSHPQLDFEYLLRRARESRTERMLSVGLRLACGLLGAKLPRDSAAQFESDGATESLAASVVERLFAGAEYEPVSFVANVGFNLKARRRLREKIRYFRFIFTPTDGDLAALSLPAGLTFIYYLLRPFRLILKGSGEH
ncbi:MAG TPA: nucleotidyltransferase family protein [Pyrinomonadaceae bacterium]|nr:nucleotidyltransferase family protein [Pyrinomonadaceae bacterium]